MGLTSRRSQVRSLYRPPPPSQQNQRFPFLKQVRQTLQAHYERFFFRDRFIMSASAFLAPPLPETNERTRPLAHASIDAPVRDPELKYAPCPLRYTDESCP